MNLKERIETLLQLGEHLRQEDDFLKAVMHQTYHNNKWFTIENQEDAVEAIAHQFLSEEKLQKWLEPYSLLDEGNSNFRVGLVMAGNIPLVGFHDLLCVFVAGFRARIKLSEKDKYLLPYIFKILESINPGTKQYFEIVETLSDFDAVIATGSNNSARYFESYFGKYPNIIRKNRNGIAVLTGNETQEELIAFGKDIFQFYGLGCRNVSKLYVPEGYAFELLLEALHEYKEIVLHSKYKNNFDYNYALYILNRIPYQANGCILLTENEAIPSRIASLHYEYYSDNKQLGEELHLKQTEIQCIVSKNDSFSLTTIPFGKAQQPELWDYADGVDTMEWLATL
ncbi:MAG: acyl-CoA reductase [Bacteroidetes bacterium]|nr:acyl-CoA reductase [Bacteroidota bacterium]